MSTPAQRPERTAHAELMDRVYRRQRHIYDVTRKYYLLGRDRMIAGLAARPGESIVEIGCGTARNLIRMAELYPGVRLYGLDASSEMLRTAQEAVARAGLSDRIVLKQALADELTPSLFGIERPFDHVVFSYSLSMIPNWRGALKTAARAVHEDGMLHVVDFGDLKTLWPAAAGLLRAWLRVFHVAPRAELLALLERGKSAERLFVLPGRYAFVLKARPGQIAELGL